MKKNTITALYNYFVKNDDTIDLSAVVEDIRTEYEKSAAKASAKMDAIREENRETREKIDTSIRKLKETASAR